MPRFKLFVYVGGARRGGLAAFGGPRLHMSLRNPPARNPQIVLFEGTPVATEAGMGGTRTIYINKKQVSVAGSPLTADEILTAGGYDPQDYSLFLVPRLNAGGGGQPGQAGGGGDNNNNNGAGNNNNGAGNNNNGDNGGSGQPGQTGDNGDNDNGGSGQPGQTGDNGDNDNGGSGQPGQTVEIKKGQAISISDGLHFNAILKNVPYGFT